MRSIPNGLRTTPTPLPTVTEQGLLDWEIADYYYQVEAFTACLDYAQPDISAVSEPQSEP